MQTNRKQRPSQVQSTAGRGAYSSYKKADTRSTLILLGVLCLLVPPVGILLAWRAHHLDIPTRAIFSAAGFGATVLIFFLLMRPSGAVSTISPVPATPQTIGYGTSAQYAAPAETEVPAPPAAALAAPSATEDPGVIQEPGELTDDTIVYAVTNNASSYHLYEICDTQENRRALTLRDALNEGLAPCEKCVGAKG